MRWYDLCWDVYGDPAVGKSYSFGADYTEARKASVEVHYHPEVLTRWQANSHAGRPPC